MKSVLSINSPTTVEPMVLVQSHFPFVHIFILARIKELENPPEKYAIKLAITILGVNPKILTSAITMVIAQRLVRKLCPACHQEINLEGEDLELVKNIYDSINDPEKPPFTGKSFKGVGCDKCNGTGYKGRIGIFEIVLNSSKLEDIVQDNPSEREIKRLMQEEGQLDMSQDGVWKIVIGMTTVEEVKRVVDLVRREGKDVV